MRALVGSWDAGFEAALGERADQGLERRLRAFDGRELVDLSSNDYLGLASHPALAEAAARAARERGAGARASRLVTGTDRAYLELEERLAEWAGTEAALVFGSGYTANVGAIAALVGREDAVVADRLDHASIWDGLRLSGATVYRYAHCDLDGLEERLREAAHHPRVLVVTETVFSMDGDVAPLAEIAELCERHGAALYVDDAHGVGVFGPEGAGVPQALGVRVDLQLGTFSKAFGVYGAWVAGRRVWIDWLVNACRSLVYTTGLPPAVIDAAAAALDLVVTADDRRAALSRKAGGFRARLEALGYETCGSTTQIVPALVGDSEEALALSGMLEKRGVLAVAFRPPTVPSGTARLRFSLKATHDDDELERALAAIPSRNGGAE